MSDHLRLAPEQYAALCRACLPLSLVGSYRAFQHRLAVALRPHDAALACFVAGLRLKQAGILRRHFEKLRAEMEQPDSRADEPTGHVLSFHEWQAVSQAFALARLHDGSLDAFQDRLADIAQDHPVLAEKLSRLAAGQLAMLYARVKAGKRCCA